MTRGNSSTDERRLAEAEVRVRPPLPAPRDLLTPNQRRRAGQVFDRVAEIVGDCFPGAEIRGRLGAGDDPAELHIRIGTAKHSHALTCPNCGAELAGHPISVATSVRDREVAPEVAKQHQSLPGVLSTIERDEGTSDLAAIDLDLEPVAPAVLDLSAGPSTGGHLDEGNLNLGLVLGHEGLNPSERGGSKP